MVTTWRHRMTLYSLSASASAGVSFRRAHWRKFTASHGGGNRRRGEWLALHLFQVHWALRRSFCDCVALWENAPVTYGDVWKLSSTLLFDFIVMCLCDVFTQEYLQGSKVDPPPFLSIRSFYLQMSFLPMPFLPLPSSSLFLSPPCPPLPAAKQRPLNPGV